MRGKSFSLGLFQEEPSDQGLFKMQKSKMEDDPPIKGNRLLSDIYHRCNVAVCEPDHKEVINEGNFSFCCYCVQQLLHFLLVLLDVAIFVSPATFMFGC